MLHSSPAAPVGVLPGMGVITSGDSTENEGSREDLRHGNLQGSLWA